MDEKEKKVKRKWRNIKESLLAIILILIGIGIMFGLQVYENAANEQVVATIVQIDGGTTVEMKETSSVFQNVIKPIFSNIGITLIVLGIGTLLLEVYGYTSYFRSRLAEVFTDKEIIDLLDLEYRKKLKYNLTDSIYSPNTEDSKAILDLFDTEMGNLLNEYYFDSYTLNVDVNLNGGFISKEVIKTIVLKEINTSSKNFYDEFVNMSFKKLPNGMNPFELEKVKINGESIPDTEYEIIRTTNGSLEKYIGKFKQPQEIKDKLTLKIKYKTIVPIKDVNYTIRINHLCKKFLCEVTYNDSQMEVSSRGFGFSTKDQLPFKNSSLRNLAKSESNGWILPGEGLVFTIFKK